mmetsp:Transcript_48915/g.106588  ORF Transcript_48915/g.106588 Transcript_48915/m.106588 type:complete len:242 (+) Transcript_48915:227-952(+)
MDFSVFAWITWLAGASRFCKSSAARRQPSRSKSESPMEIRLRQADAPLAPVAAAIASAFSLLKVDRAPPLCSPGVACSTRTPSFEMHSCNSGKKFLHDSATQESFDNVTIITSPSVVASLKSLITSWQHRLSFSATSFFMASGMRCSCKGFRRSKCKSQYTWVKGNSVSSQSRTIAVLSSDGARFFFSAVSQCLAHLASGAERQKEAPSSKSVHVANAASSELAHHTSAHVAIPKLELILL